MPTRPFTTPGLAVTRLATPGVNDSEPQDPRPGFRQAVSALVLNKTDKILVAATLGAAAFLILVAILVGLVACLCWRSA